MTRRSLPLWLCALLSQGPVTALAAEDPAPEAPQAPQASTPPSESSAFQAPPKTAPQRSATVEPPDPGQTAPGSETTPPTETAPPTEAAPSLHAAGRPRITDPQFRDTQTSAYSLQKGQLALTTSLLGASSNDLFAAIGVAYGFGHGLQAGINVAHLGAGLFNLSGKWTFLEKGPLAASFNFDPIYIHGDWVWLVGYQNLFAGIDMWLLPANLNASYLPLPWLQLDFGLQYVAGIITGDIQSSRATLDANISAQEFALHPGLRVHVLGRSTFNVNVDLPLYSAAPANVEAEVELTPGVAAGGRIGGTARRSLDETYRVNVSVRSMVTQKFFIDLGFNIGPRLESLYGSIIAPRLAVEARF